MILTNYHVIAGAYDIQVMFSDGDARAGRVLATIARASTSRWSRSTPSSR